MTTALGHKRLRMGLLLAFMGMTTAMLSPGGRGQQIPVGGPASQRIVAGWVATGQLNTARMYHTATLLQDGRVLVAGGEFEGCCSTRAQTSAEIYDPVSGSFSVTGSLQFPRSGHTATLLLDGRVLVIGGSDPQDTSTELYDPATGSWSFTGSLTEARVGYTATLLKSGKVLVAGGYGHGDLRSAEVYDPGTGRWSETTPLLAARSRHVATRLKDGRVLVAGGELAPRDFNDIENSDVLKSTEIYDPNAGTWSSAADLNAAFAEFADHSANLLTDGNVLILGGLTAGIFTPERYDPTTGKWSNTGGLNLGRVLFTATRLSNGQVLVAGGTTQQGRSYLDSAELYDPGAGVWSNTSNLVTGRFGHTATLLADGRVLIAGGLGTRATGEILLKSAELYEPANALPPGTIGPGYTGSWYDPAQSGHGLSIEVLSDNRFYATWFAFNPAGTQQAWFTGVGTYSGNTAIIREVEQPTGGRWIPNFDPTEVVRNAWGTLTFTFTDCDHGKLDFNSVNGYGMGSMNLTRLTHPAGLTCS